jgi:hypothetical protein
MQTRRADLKAEATRINKHVGQKAFNESGHVLGERDPSV